MTITGDQPRPLTREELFALFKTQRAVRAFEELFDLVPDELVILQDNIEAATLEAGAAYAQANEAIAQLTRIADALDRLVQAPMPPLGTMAEQSADNITVTSGTAFLRSIAMAPWGQKSLIVQINGGGIPQFQTIGTTANTTSWGACRFSNNEFGSYIYFCKSRSATVGGMTVVQDNDMLGSIVWNPSDGSSFNTGSARMWVQVDDPTPSLGSVGASWNLELMNKSGVAQLAYMIGSELTHDFNIGDNEEFAWRIKINGAEVYMQIDTRNGAERMLFGDAAINPEFIFQGTKTLTHGSTTLLATTVALADAAGANAGTLNNAPTAGDPAKWVTINDNGTILAFPAWAV